MTAIVGFAGPGYGLLAVDRNIVAREAGGAERVLSSDGGKLHAGPDGFFAGAGKLEMLQAVARRVKQTTEPSAVATAMRAERKNRYAKRLTRGATERSFGVLLRKGARGPDVFVLKPDDGYRPTPVPAGRPLVTGPEDPRMRPLIGAFRLLFTPTPGEESLGRNLDLLHLYFWLRHRLDPAISAEFDLAVVAANVAEMRTNANAFEGDGPRAMQIAQYVEELGTAFRELGALIRKANG